jgi:hypothetical protein
MLYALLPKMVKSRLPVLTSFRRTIKMTTARRSTPAHSRHTSAGTPHGLPNSNDAYTNLNNEVVTREQLWQLSRRARDPSPEEVGSSGSSSAGSSQTAAAPAFDRSVGLPVHETQTGVEWDTAVTALLLLSKACARAQQPDAKPENTRALIVDANKWLLRSLPSHLEPSELEEIEEVLPIGLDNPERISRRQARTQSSASEANKPWLRRAIAFSLLQTSLFIALLIPYVTAFINTCYRLERRNHITERFLTGGIDITNAVGESGMEVKDAMVRLGRGRLANAVVQTGGWVFESIIGGVSDGAGEGVAIVGQAMLSRETQRVE